MNDSNIAASILEENIYEELEGAHEQVDEIMDGIGEIIIEIAEANKNFCCSTCIHVAEELYQLLKNYASEEDCDSIKEQYSYITGRNLDE